MQRRANHPLRYLFHQAGILRERNKHARRDIAAGRVTPAEQRFRADRPVGAELDFGLIHQIEPAVFGDTLTEIVQQLEINVALLIALCVKGHMALVKPDSFMHGTDGATQRLIGRGFLRLPGHFTCKDIEPDIDALQHARVHQRQHRGVAANGFLIARFQKQRIAACRHVIEHGVAFQP